MTVQSTTPFKDRVRADVNVIANLDNEIISPLSKNTVLFSSLTGVSEYTLVSSNTIYSPFSSETLCNGLIIFSPRTNTDYIKIQALVTGSTYVTMYELEPGQSVVFACDDASILRVESETAAQKLHITKMS